MSSSTAWRWKSERAISSAGCPATRPAPPHLRMRPDSASSLVGATGSLDPVFREDRPGPTKRYLGVDPDRAVADDRALPIDAVYLLAPWDRAAAAPSLHPVRPTEALPVLMANRHMTGSLPLASHRTDFATLGRLVRTVPVREVVRPRGLDAVDSVASAIVADLRAL